jgi:hypothetical protein
MFMHGCMYVCMYVCMYYNMKYNMHLIIIQLLFETLSDTVNMVQNKLKENSFLYSVQYKYCNYLQQTVLQLMNIKYNEVKNEQTIFVVQIISISCDVKHETHQQFYSLLTSRYTQKCCQLQNSRLRL